MLEFKGQGIWQRSGWKDIGEVVPGARQSADYRDDQFLYRRDYGTEIARHVHLACGAKTPCDACLPPGKCSCGRDCQADFDARPESPDPVDNTRERLASAQRLLSLFFDIRDGNAYQNLPPQLKSVIAEGLLREALAITSQVAPE